jgi:predicted nucleic acid-binding protein
MPEMYTRPYLDSSVYIAAIKNEGDGRGEIAKRILDDGRAGRFQIFASTFIKVEVLKDRGKPPLTADQAKTVDEFFQHSSFVWLDLDLSTAEKARDLARAHGFRPGDAVHLASAIRADCDQLLVWDDDFRKGTFDGVLVTEPHWSGQPPLV